MPAGVGRLEEKSRTRRAPRAGAELCHKERTPAAKQAAPRRAEDGEIGRGEGRLTSAVCATDVRASRGEMRLVSARVIARAGEKCPADGAQQDQGSRVVRRRRHEE
jgi:hypothetical protein